MARIEVIGREKGFSMDPARAGRLDRFVTYRTEDQQLHFVAIPDESYNEAAEEAAIRQAEAERRLTQPRTFQIP